LEATWRVFPLARISNACGIFTHYQPFLYPSIPAEMYRIHRAVLKSVLFSLSFRRKVLNPAQPVYMVYDKRDRLVLTQDGNQRQDNQWTFTKYDALNRPVLTGTKTISGSRDAVQAAVNDFYEQSNPRYETRSGNWNTGDHGYTDLSYPKGISEYSYLTATYYDDYGFHGGEPAYVPITGDDIDIGEHLPKPKGQATGAKVKVLGDNEFLKSSTYYDNKYRVILTRAGQYNGDHQQLLLSKAITEEGYIYIYVSNESNLNVNVYFDDLKITHTAADMVVQANDYYPFGLTMKPSDFQRDGEQGNKFLYQGKEIQSDLGLDTYDFHARMYDPALGRTFQQDPHSENYYNLSSYSWVANNPLNVVDPDGRDFRVKTETDEEKKTGTITISTTIHVIGSEKDQKKVDSYNNHAKKKLEDGTFEQDGVTYTVKFAVNYVLAEKAPEELADGDNVLILVDGNAGVSQVPGREKSNGDGTSTFYTGNKGHISKQDQTKAVTLHETMHFLGLTDRYDEVENTNPRQTTPHKGFSNDIMGSRTSGKISQIHYNNWGKAALKKVNGTIRTRVDLDKHGKLIGGTK
jgi:RHS repeat-associated protein